MSPRSNSSVSGAKKVAILLTVLGEEAASVICRQLPPSEVQRIAAEVAALDSVPAELAQQVLEEYQQQIGGHRFLIEGGVDYASRLVQKAFGDDGAKSLLPKSSPGQNNGHVGLGWLQQTDPQELAAVLEKEQAQTSAVILSQFESKQASRVLSKLTPDLRTDVVLKLAQLRQVPPATAEAISQVLAKKIKPKSAEASRQVTQPVATVPELMNQLDSATSKSILEALERDNAALAEEIRNQMFTFEDLVNIPETGLRDWIATVDKKVLALALKGAGEAVKAHIFKAMSSRAVEMLKEDMEVLGKVRGKDVTKAQQDAIATARQLEAEGKMMLRPEGEDESLA